MFDSPIFLQLGMRSHGKLVFQHDSREERLKLIEVRLQQRIKFVIVALAASSAFMTPISSPVNTLVVGPGNYAFGDFVRVGVPFTVVVLIVSVLLVPWLLPMF